MLSNLMGLMKERKVTQTTIAKLLKLSNNSVCQKMNGKHDFTSTEMFAIQRGIFPDKTIEFLFKKLEDQE